jgi:hypothetical protein
VEVPNLRFHGVVVRSSSSRDSAHAAGGPCGRESPLTPEYPARHRISRSNSPRLQECPARRYRFRLQDARRRSSRPELSRLQDCPADVAASACRISCPSSPLPPAGRPASEPATGLVAPAGCPPVSSLPPVGRLALELVARIRRACNSASPSLEAQGRSCRDRRSAPPNVLAHSRVCRRSFTRRPRAQLAEPAQRSSVARDSTPGCWRWMQSRRHRGSSTSVGMIVWTL